MSKHLLRFCSILLSFVMVFNMLPHQALADVLTTEEQDLSAGKTDMEPAEEGQIVEEIVENRSKYSKEFKLSNGMHMAAIYGTAVHYEKDGRWQEIDNTLIAAVSDGDAVYSNTEGVWNVSFPSQLSSGKRISLTKDGYTLQFGMAGALSNSGHVVMDANASQMSVDDPVLNEALSVQAAEISTAQVMQIDAMAISEAQEHPEAIADKAVSRLQYTGVYEDTNIVYDLQSNELKESVVIGHFDPTLCGYQYELDVGSMIPVMNDDNSIYFYDSEQENVVMIMPAPFMVDAENQYSFDVEVVLRGSGSSYTLTYFLPQEWMAEEGRVWPVVLDPIVSADLTRSNIRDICVAEHYIDDNNAGVIGCGYGESWGIHRSFIKYDEIPEISSSDVIIGASMTLVNYGTAATPLTVEVHKVLDNWDSVGLTWNNMPDTDNTVEDYANILGWGYYHWDVTDIVREWYEGENTGMMFKATDAVENGGTALYKEFYSSDYGYYYRPELHIYFKNNNGLENYWDYTTSTAGRAGTGYINHYTGNLVWVRNDIGFGGNRMPVSINHVYNANDSLNNAFGLGYGWRTNYNQRIYSWSENSNYYVWEDGDGTKHYFLYDSSDGLYYDEDGLELVLDDYLPGSIWTYSITDKSDNVSYFDSLGRLGRIENNQAQTSCIAIEHVPNSDRIDTIEDGVGRTYAFTYGNDGLLDRISYTGTGSSEVSYVAFAYTGSRLTSIVDQDELSVTYAYTTNNLLSSVTDVDGYKLTYTYNIIETGKPSRVKTVKETDNGAVGGELTISYGQNQTTFTDHNGNKQVMQFNNWGNTISVQDGQGRAQYAGYGSSNMGDGGKGNQLTMASKLQNTVSNLLSDNSVENFDLWTTLNSAVNKAQQQTGYIGGYSLKMTHNNTSTVSGVYREFSAEPNTTYTFSAVVKTGKCSTWLEIYDNGTSASGEVLPDHTEWTRMQVSYTTGSSVAGPLQVRLMSSAMGAVYMDCVQLEKTPTASRYNLVANGDFRDTSAWSASSGRTGISASAVPQLDTWAYRLAGTTDAQNRVCQTVKVSGAAGDTFVLAGWGKGQSVPLTADDEEPRQFSLIAEFVYGENDTEEFVLQFNPYVDNWQYAAKAIVPTKPYSAVKISLAYDYNANEAYFDGIQLFREEFGASYTYDEDGNIISVVDLQKKTTTYEYASNDLTKIIENGSPKMTYEYDGHHNVTKAMSATGLTYTFTYDTYGNNTSVSISNGEVTMSSSAVYSDDGNRLVSTTDAVGNVTTYNYNANTNVLVSVKYPNGESTKTEYTYDSMYRLVEATAMAGTEKLSATYSYGSDPLLSDAPTYDLLTKLTTGSTTYNFAYGNFGLRKSIAAGDRTLATYTYTSRNNYLHTLAYGNGDDVEYTYDNLGRVIGERYEDNDTVTYAYDNDGALATVTDSATGRKTTYYYDFTERLMKYVERGGGYSHSVGYEYDTLNNLTKLVETINGSARSTSYTYDADNRVTGVTDGASTREYTYDAYGRVSQRVTKHNGVVVFTETITYKGTTGTTSGQVAKLDTLVGTYKYDYDANGNIVRAKLVIGNQGWGSTYAYDSQNQLIRENNKTYDQSWTWEYDNAGNIVAKKQYDYKNSTEALGEIKHTFDYDYADSGWKDLLVSWDEKPITNDAIGNMLSDGTWTYTWEHGRELASMSSGGTTWSFTYDANGMRTKRTDGTTTYSYVYNGGQLSQMTIDAAEDVVLNFTYDASGTPLSVNYNGTYYYYVTDLQGDVVAIVDTAGVKVVEYLYDAWGRLLIIGGTKATDLGVHNPLRYRGYVYDPESGLYYLQSRYYNPELGRFINADAYASTGQGLLGNNMFAYCLNNAVSYADHPGFTPYKLHDITSDTEAGLYEPVKKGDNWKSRKDKRHGSEKRGKSGARERNVAHPNGEEHSRKPKGNRGLKYNILPTPQVSNPYITAFPAITGGGVAVFVVLAFSCFVMPNARSM